MSEARGVDGGHQASRRERDRSQVSERRRVRLMSGQDDAAGGLRREAPQPPAGGQGPVESVQRERRSLRSRCARHDEGADVGAQSKGLVEQTSGLRNGDAAFETAVRAGLVASVEPFQEVPGCGEEIHDTAPRPSQGVEEVECEVPELGLWYAIRFHSNRITYVIRL